MKRTWFWYTRAFCRLGGDKLASINCQLKITDLVGLGCRSYFQTQLEGVFLTPETPTPQGDSRHRYGCKHV